MKTLGASLDRVSPGEVEVGLPFRNDLTQHHGFMAAAVLTAVVDVACGYAAMSLMPPGSSVLTIEYKANFLAPAQGERMLARGRVIRPGRTVTVCAGDVVAVDRGHEKLVATLLATMLRVGGERPTARHRPARRCIIDPSLTLVGSGGGAGAAPGEPAGTTLRLRCDSGGLFAYGPTIERLGGQAARFVDRILKGAGPADLPRATHEG